MKQTEPLNRTISTKKKDISTIKKETVEKKETQVKRNITSVKGEVSSLKGGVSSVKRSVTTLNRDGSSVKRDIHPTRTTSIKRDTLPSIKRDTLPSSSSLKKSVSTSSTISSKRTIVSIQPKKTLPSNPVKLTRPTSTQPSYARCTSTQPSYTRSTSTQPSYTRPTVSSMQSKVASKPTVSKISSQPTQKTNPIGRKTQVPVIPTKPRSTLIRSSISTKSSTSTTSSTSTSSKTEKSVVKGRVVPKDKPSVPTKKNLEKVTNSFSKMTIQENKDTNKKTLLKKVEDDQFIQSIDINNDSFGSEELNHSFEPKLPPAEAIAKAEPKEPSVRDSCLLRFPFLNDKKKPMIFKAPRVPEERIRMKAKEIKEEKEEEILEDTKEETLEDNIKEDIKEETLMDEEKNVSMEKESIRSMCPVFDESTSVKESDPSEEEGDPSVKENTLYVESHTTSFNSSVAPCTPPSRPSFSRFETPRSTRKKDISDPSLESEDLRSHVVLLEKVRSGRSKSLLGSEFLITPVRRSTRIHRRESSSVDPQDVKSLLMEANYAYSPNVALKNLDHPRIQSPKSQRKQKHMRWMSGNSQSEMKPVRKMSRIVDSENLSPQKTNSPSKRLSEFVEFKKAAYSSAYGSSFITQHNEGEMTKELSFVTPIRRSRRLETSSRK